VSNSFLDKETIDEVLMKKFLSHVDRINLALRRFNDFEGYLEQNVDRDVNQIFALKVISKIHEILKGKYRIDGMGEKILLNTDEFVYLSNSSSGQQESIRILQDIFFVTLANEKVFRVFEEPEAHLFPTAQKQLIELLALMVNQNDDNQLIITTHSPYVLTVLNNLLFATRVIAKNPDAESEVGAIVEKEYRMSSADFSAYSLNKTEVSGRAESKSIASEKTQMIEQNYLDEVSEMLGADFDALYKIHSRSFSRI
jgi:hypothetical protein